MEIRTVGVLGCGLMGSGIAQVCAASGYKTVVREVDETFLQKGLGRIKKFLDDGVAKGKATAEARDKTLGNLSGTTTFEALKDCDLVVEAIVENLDEKCQTYAALEQVIVAVNDAWQNRRDNVLKQAEELTGYLQTIEEHGDEGERAPTPPLPLKEGRGAGMAPDQATRLLDNAARALSRAFDSRHGGRCWRRVADSAPRGGEFFDQPE